MDCPICLDEMTDVDLNHPLLCETRACTYNFCQHCIESLITSSKDDYIESSDGSNQTKIFLLCPSCRFDLSKSIRDTLLLRKVDSLYYALDNHNTHRNNDNEDDNCNVNDSGNENENDNVVDKDDAKRRSTNDSILTASQLRLKDAMKNHKDVQEAIQAAREREEQFFATNSFKTLRRNSLHLNRNPFHIHEGKEDDDTFTEEVNETEAFEEDMIEYEEYGVEVDLSVGAHDSFHMPGPPSSHHQEDSAEKQERYDSSLFSGLDYFITQGERVYITEMLISGDPDQLAMAAQVLHTVSQLVHDNNNSGQVTSPTTQSINKLGPTNSRQQEQTRQQTATTTKPSADVAKPVLHNSTSDGSVRSRSSIFALIEDNEKVIATAADNASSDSAAMEAAAAANFIMNYENPHNNSCSNSNINKIRQRNNQTNNENRRRQAEHMRFELELQRSLELSKNYPLPVRMPKYVDISSLKGISFLNYTWDGTVMDAYSKITIQGRAGKERITSKKMSTKTHPGIRKVLGGNYGAVGDVQIELPNQARILIGQVNRELGRQGVMKGDVLTHINEECILGKRVEEINNAWPKEFLLDLDNANSNGRSNDNNRSSSPLSIGLVFNAERSVADALKRRAEVMYNQ